MRSSFAAAALAAAVALPSIAHPAPPAVGPVEAVVVDHGPRTLPRVALTFDACTTREPNPYDARVADELERLHVPATIFVSGGWAEEEPAAVAALAGNPLFEIGNHTFTHPHLRRASDARIREELLRTQGALAALTGHVPTLFRPPYGEYDARVVRVARELGLRTIEYDLPSGDPDAHATREALVRWVVGRARPGSIVVMHVNHRRFHTGEALPAIVEGLRARGFELVKVSELLAPGSGEAIAARPAAPVRAQAAGSVHRPARAGKPIAGV